MLPVLRPVVATGLLALGAAVLVPHIDSTAHAGIVAADDVFTYQGELRSDGAPINGTASFLFKLFNQAAGGIQIGPNVTVCDVELIDGRFTVELDFGPGAFEGSQRYLEIAVQSPAGGCNFFATLAPRQPITPAPYAIRSLAPWASSGANIFFNDGSVGIGTSTPDTHLEIAQNDATLRLTSTAVGGTSTLDLKGDLPGGLTTNVLGTLRFLDENNTVHASISSSVGLFAPAFAFAADGATIMSLTGSGNLGLGTGLPVAKIHVVDGADVEPGAGGYMVLGFTNDANLGFDNNEIMARNNGAPSTLFLNNDGGDVSICPGAGGQVGIGTSPTAAQLTVFNSLWVTGGAAPRIDVGSNGFILMDTGADITITNGGLEVNTPSGGQTFFNRTASDGTLISFINNGTSAGGIAVFGSTVSYNTFTGSHAAWTDEPIEHGALVTLTGDNIRSHDGPNCEPVYGIAPSSVANHAGCLGAYLSGPDPDVAASTHLVASVGNGEMWVVETGAGNLVPGDALISSDVPGCAMVDDPARFEVGHVVARVAEPIDWTAIKSGVDGRRRALVSVFFDPFVRQGDAAALRAEVEDLRDENESLRERLEAIEALVNELASGGAR